MGAFGFFGDEFEDVGVAVEEWFAVCSVDWFAVFGDSVAVESDVAGPGGVVVKGVFGDVDGKCFGFEGDGLEVCVGGLFA